MSVSADVGTCGRCCCGVSRGSSSTGSSSGSSFGSYKSSSFSVVALRSALMKLIAAPLLLFAGKNQALIPDTCSRQCVWVCLSFSSVIVCVCVCAASVVSGGVLNKALWQFGKMIQCVQPGADPLMYNDYGCWCGLGGSGNTVDEIDE